MNLAETRLVLIGGGNMGSAVLAGLLASGRIRASRIFVTDVQQEILGSLKKKFKVRVGMDNSQSVGWGDVLLLCVKPQQMSPLLDELRGRVKPPQLVISIAAGIKTRYLEQRLRNSVAVIRVMPNTPALLRAGALVYCLGRHVKRHHEALAQNILSTVGRVWKTTEGCLDAVTALSGSGPAYVFFLAECLAGAGARLNLPRNLAEALARQTIYGAGLMLSQSPESAARLRQRVTSPGGTTEAALRVMEKAGLGSIVAKALKAACQRSRELSPS